MDINQLIAIVKKKLENSIQTESILIEDKSFLHKNHTGNQLNISIHFDQFRSTSIDI